MRIYLLLIFLAFSTVKSGKANCIEPRNSVSQDTIADIQWSFDDRAFYISTMGKLWVYELAVDHSPRLLHEVCPGRFPVIEVSEKYYAVGSDFLSTLSIYDRDSDNLVSEIHSDSENIRAIAFSPFSDYIALSTSNYDVDGFFDTNRNIEVWDYQTAELVAKLVTGEKTANSVYLPFSAGVNFVTEARILVAGLDLEDAFVPIKPIAYLWDWYDDEIKRLELEPDTLIEITPTNELITMDFDNDESLKLEIISLSSSLQVLSSQNYDIPFENHYKTRFSSTATASLLAIENQEGTIWIIDLSSERVLFSRRLERFATEIAFDHEGKRMVLGYTDGMIQVWDLQTDTISTIGNLFEK